VDLDWSADGLLPFGRHRSSGGEYAMVSAAVCVVEKRVLESIRCMDSHICRYTWRWDMFGPCLNRSPSAHAVLFERITRACTRGHGSLDLEQVRFKSVPGLFARRGYQLIMRGVSAGASNKAVPPTQASASGMQVHSMSQQEQVISRSSSLWCQRSLCSLRCRCRYRLQAACGANTACVSG
jgi:hypothetical protein